MMERLLQEKHNLILENEKLRALILEIKHGAEYEDELGDKIDAVLGPRL